jgi:precorrin-6B methylase 2
MLKSLIEKIFSILQYIIFNIVAPKMHADLLKNFVDSCFAIFEKIACRFKFLAKYYLKIFEELVENEIKILNISEKNSVLVIGGGSVPVTPILIAMKTGANVESIDFYQKAIIDSKKVIESFEIKAKIKIIHAHGQSYPLERFDVIFIVYGIKWEKELLNHIAKNMKETTQLIFRTTVTVDKTKEDKINTLSKLFDVKKVVRTKSFGQTDSILLKKKINS